MKKITILLLTLYLSSALASVRASEAKTVNALSFWGYLDNPDIIQTIENKCHVKFSYDSYWTNSEFLSTYRHRSNEYDVIILSNLIYGSIKEQLPNFDSNLWAASRDYYPYIKKYYLEHHYAKNTAFFTHAMVGFLYNPKNITIDKNQDIFDIFKNAKQNNVVLVDDSGEIGNMLTEANKQKYQIKRQTKLTYDNLKKLTQDAHVYITSDFGKVFNDPKFAFAYIWSGDALKFIKESKNPYKFIMPITATSICTDIIVQMKPTAKANCVARILASQELLKYFENDTYYFSPYFKNDVHDPLYDEIFENAKKNMHRYKMIQPAYDFSEFYDSQWSNIKAKYLDNLRETK